MVHHKCSYINNTALRGGVQYFDVYSNFTMHQTAHSHFQDNTATEFGGAIYVGDVPFRSECFFHIQNDESLDMKTTPLVFEKNAAGIRGSVLYGGLLDKCHFSSNRYTNAWELFNMASAAYAEFCAYLRHSYMQHARVSDAVGRERYSLGSRSYNGIDLDLSETYEWGWTQLQWVRSEMQNAAASVAPGATVRDAVEILETDPDRAVHDVDEFRDWMQSLQDVTISNMDGTHFDIPAPVRKIEAMIAPPGGALAMYYTGPSEDFSRPGRTWYPTGGKTSFPLWREVSVAYHEGVPGHHFQIGTTMTLSGNLSRYQRLLAGSSGYSEGWALYAERLMSELGYLDNPDHYMGYLDGQALRSVRVIIDIGMHLQLAIPRFSDFHPGETWTPELAYEFMCAKVHFPTDFIASEIDRYLGIPGQAISYKVGERVWLDARSDAKTRRGANFDLKMWHNDALNLGPMGLAQMKTEMTTG